MLQWTIINSRNKTSHQISLKFIGAFWICLQISVVTSQSFVANIPRFSSRYRSELLRGTGHGSRGSSTPVYVPTVPTVSTTSTTEQTIFSVSLYQPTAQWYSWLKVIHWQVHIASPGKSFILYKIIWQYFVFPFIYVPLCVHPHTAPSPMAFGNLWPLIQSTLLVLCSNISSLSKYNTLCHLNLSLIMEGLKINLQLQWYWF